MEMKWIDLKTVMINIKLNDICNTSCLHCKSHGKNKQILEIDFLENLEKMLIFLINKHISKFEICFIGGEITLISIDFLTRLFNHYNDKLNNLVKNFFIEINTTIISNFIIPIKNRDNYFNLFNNLLEFKKDKLTYEINTSYEIGLFRFKNEKIFKIWKDNCENYKGELSLLITLNKQTCNHIDEILNDKWFLRFKKIAFQGLNELDGIPSIIIPDYNDIYQASKKIREKKKKIQGIQYDNMEKAAYYININNDSTVTVDYSESVALTLNKYSFKLQDIEKNKEKLWEHLNIFKNKRINNIKNKTCLYCNEYTTCNFGFENYKYKCPSFKKDLSDLKEI